MTPRIREIASLNTLNLWTPVSSNSVRYLERPGQLELVCFYIYLEISLMPMASPLDMSNSERLLSYAILSLITSKPLARAHVIEEDDENGKSVIQPARSGLMNHDGAWCWREDCSGIFHLENRHISLLICTYRLLALHQANTESIRDSSICCKLIR